ncbi:ribonuclease H2 subunit B [Pseudoscourfieldia marina]
MSGYRVLLRPSVSSCEAGEGEGEDAFRFIRLSHPRSSQSRQFMLLSSGSSSSSVQQSVVGPSSLICSLDVYRSSHSSWLVPVDNNNKKNNSSSSSSSSLLADGGIYTCVPVDPLMLSIANLEKARVGSNKRMSDGAHEGVFVDADTIFEDDEFPDVRILKEILAPADVAAPPLARICETKVSGGVAFFRLCDKRTLAYLVCKVRSGAERLQGHACVQGLDASERRAYALDLLTDLLAPIWAARLRSVMQAELPYTGTNTNGGPAVTHAADLPPVPNQRNSTGEDAAERRKRQEKLKRAAASAQAKADKARKLAQGTKSITSFFGSKA